MRNLFWMILISIGLLPAVFATPTMKRAHASITHYANFDTLNITLSSNDLNTIVFKQGVQVEKIVDLMGGANLYHAERDSMGQVYLTVKSAAPFTLFVATNKHHHLALHITPETVSGQTMVFQYADSKPIHKKISPKRKQTVVSVQTRLHQLSTRTLPTTFKPIRTKHTVQKLKHGLQLEHTQTYSNGKASGVIYALQNTSSSNQHIDVHSLLKKNVLGVRLEKSVVPAHGAVWCYIWEKI